MLQVAELSEQAEYVGGWAAVLSHVRGSGRGAPEASGITRREYADLGHPPDLHCFMRAYFASRDAIFSPKTRELFGPLAVTMFPSTVTPGPV